MWRTPLALLVVGLAACSSGGDADTPATTAVDTAALTSADARAAFESGTIVDGGPVARIRIDGTSVDVVAVQGTGNEVTHLAASVLPCAPGVTVIAGGAPFADLGSTPDDGRIDVTTPIGSCTYDVVQVAVVPAADFDPATAGVGRTGALVLVTPGPQDDVRQVVVGELDEDSTTTTTEASATTTTTQPVVQAPQPTGRDAINALLGAWRAGDRGLVLAVADPTQVDLLFVVPVEPTEDRGGTQGDANAVVQCVFRLPSGPELQIRAAPREGGFIVDFVFRSAPS